MDFVEGLPISKGYYVVMVVVGKLSKYAHFLALKHHFTASKVASLFLDNILRLHGRPKRIVYDRGATFTNSFWREFFKL